ncbi:hypothetical protein DFJ74DRAFT_702309 [Hyaloraphidium curvatum]|nr:hypothetical protein DFJ74DRAFT_702309 [Hyaloraphidium curvatum]
MAAHDSPGTAGIRATLRIGAGVFGASAALLLLAPGNFIELLGLTPTAELIWAHRMTAITCAALGGTMTSVSLHGSQQGVFLAGRIMQIAAAGLAIVTLTIPTPWTWFTLTYAGTGFGFSLTYAYSISQT